MAPGLQSTGSKVVVLGVSCSVVCGIFLDQRPNPCLLPWQAGSLPLSHQGRPWRHLILAWSDSLLWDRWWHFHKDLGGLFLPRLTLNVTNLPFPGGKYTRCWTKSIFTPDPKVSLPNVTFPAKALLQSTVIYSPLPLKLFNKLTTAELTGL